MVYDWILNHEWLNRQHDAATLFIICDRICKRGLICAFINTEKSRFEILITVYRECLMPRL